MENRISAGTIARTMVLLLALTNQVLGLCGIQTIPLEDEDINALVTTLWTVTAALVAWWKNNSFTRAALAGDAAMKEAKTKYERIC